MRHQIGPLGIEGDACDVAEALLFLVNDAARFITGVLLPADVGLTAIGQWPGTDFSNATADTVLRRRQIKGEEQ